MVLSRLDYGNATLAGLPGNQLDRLQSVMNAAARLVCSTRKYEHITPLLRDLHWLRVSERIEFKLSVLVFRCLHGTWRASYVVWRTWIQERGCDLRRRLPLSHHLRVVRQYWWPRVLRRCAACLEHFASSVTASDAACNWHTRHLQASFNKSYTPSYSLPTCHRKSMNRDRPRKWGACDPQKSHSVAALYLLWNRTQGTQ